VTDQPAAWGAPLLKIDKLWVRIEQRLAVWVIVLELFTLCAWVAVKGFAAYYTPGGNVVGVIFRSVVGAIVLGLIAHLITRKQKTVINGFAVTAAGFIGLLLAPSWANAGGEYASNISGWLQNASSLALIGGPRGLVTRLTLFLALLGGSMAASKGKHINIDIATRYFPKSWIKPIGMIGWFAAAIVCFAASYGFVDSIAVTKFRAEAFRSCDQRLDRLESTGGPASPDRAPMTGVCETAVSERLGVVVDGIGVDAFLLRKQIALDFRTIPKVIAGEPYDKYLTPQEWNRFIREGGWVPFFPEEAVRTMYVPEDDPTLAKMPMVFAPTTGEGRDSLIRDLNFVLPLGLLAIGLKFLLRILLVASNQVRFDPESAHDEEDLTHAHDHDAEINEVKA
jgi:hypothetical protein